MDADAKPAAADDAGAVPRARLAARRRFGYLWMLPVLAALLAGWLLVDGWHAGGKTITLRFDQGHGLKPGDALRYRGIRVGEVEQLTLGDELDAVFVTLRLLPEADGLARDGSRFWIVRPRVEVSGIQGLDTLVGPRYVGVLPAAGAAAEKRYFVGLERPPPLESIEPGGLEIVLTTPGKGNLKVGAPISYRQVIVGSVLDVGLSRDAIAVEARAYIHPDYTNLIRRDVRFWRARGASASVSLDGLSVDVDSVHSLILGGINLAIPPRPGPRAGQLARFPLHDEPEDAWLDWTPGLSLYAETASVERPQLVAAQRDWRYRNWLYQTRDASRRGWLLPLADGLLGPADLLLAPADALADSARLRVAGERLPPPADGALQVYANGLARRQLQHDFSAWPQTRRRWPDVPEDSLVVSGDASPRFVGAARYNADGETWRLDPSLPFDAGWHGAAVLAERDGALLGLLLIDDDGARVATLPTAQD